MRIPISRMKLEEKAQEKKEELQNIVKSYFSQFKINNLDEFSQMIIEKFIIITPPEEIEEIVISSRETDDITRETDDIRRCDLIIMDYQSKEARSVKPGNIFFNWKKLLNLKELLNYYESIDKIIDAINNHSPWHIVLVGLYILNKGMSLLNIEIDERHGVVIWVMWDNVNKEKKCMEFDRILELVNEELKKYKKSEMLECELKNILNDLEKMRCIEKKEIENKTKWCLIEEVKVSYE